MIPILITVLKIAPPILLFGLGLRFLLDTEEFNLKRPYRKFIGSGNWRTATKSVGFLMVAFGLLLAWLLIWPELKAILNPQFDPRIHYEENAKP